MLRLFELVRIAFTLAFAEKLDPKLRQLTRRLQPNFVFDFQSTVLKSAGAHRSSQNQPAHFLNSRRPDCNLLEQSFRHCASSGRTAPCPAIAIGGKELAGQAVQ
jgi:hypothetical protein